MVAWTRLAASSSTSFVRDDVSLPIATRQVLVAPLKAETIIVVKAVFGVEFASSSLSSHGYACIACVKGRVHYVTALRGQWG